jgi:hypothetical protein
MFLFLFIYLGNCKLQQKYIRRQDVFRSCVQLSTETPAILFLSSYAGHATINAYRRLRKVSVFFVRLEPKSKKARLFMVNFSTLNFVKICSAVILLHANRRTDRAILIEALQGCEHAQDTEEIERLHKYGRDSPPCFITRRTKTKKKGMYKKSRRGVCSISS